MAYGKNSETNPLTGRRVKPKVASSKTVGGRSKSSTIVAGKMRAGSAGRSIGRISVNNRPKAQEESFSLGLGGGDFRPRGG